MPSPRTPSPKAVRRGATATPPTDPTRGPLGGRGRGREVQDSRDSREETPRWARTRGEAGVPSTGSTHGAVTATGSDVPRPRTVRWAVSLRRVLRATAGPIFALALCCALAWVESRRAAARADLPTTLAALVIAAGFGGRIFVRFMSRARVAVDPTAPAIDLEFGFLLVGGATEVALQIPPGLDGPAYAIVYGAVALVATFAARSSTIAATALALLIEAAVRGVGTDPGAFGPLLVHGPVLGAFAALNGWVLRGRIEQIGARTRRRMEREIERMREQARSYRLNDAAPATTSATAPAPAGRIDPERVARSGVEEIQIAVRFALDLLKRSLGAHSAVLLFEASHPNGHSHERGRHERERVDRRDCERRKHLRLAEVVTDAPAIAEGPFGMGDGVLGAVVRRKAPVNLHGLRTGYRVPYYPAANAEGGVTSLVAAPILENGAVRGVLCVDRLPTRAPFHDGEWLDRPFTAHEEELVAAAARYILRAIENERVFGRLERAKAEQDQLYAAAQRLSGALTEAEVIEAGVLSARAIASFDLAAITIVHDADGSGARAHEVRAVAGAADFESLVGLRFGDNGGLVAQAVKSRCSLPHRGDHDPATQVVFTRRHPLRVELSEASDDGDDLPPALPPARSAEVRSILVLPLTLHDRALGTLVLGARRRGAFRDVFSGGSSSAAGARTTLEVLATHIATSLANARMFARLEELATTDGLTGLLNKRVLLELGAQKVRAAVRYGKPLAVVQIDIDHFKHVNDTHGHDVGDQVIKGLAGILRRLKRGADYVARFGGEEFIIICEETDAAGALHLAERVREECARTTFHAPTGPFRVTCSLGLATLPADGSTWEALYKATDDALYASKRGGRNRTTIASHLKAAAG